MALTHSQRALLRAARDAKNLLEYREKGINRRFGPNAEISVMRELELAIAAVEAEEDAETAATIASLKQ